MMSEEQLICREDLAPQSPQIREIVKGDSVWEGEGVYQNRFREENKTIQPLVQEVFQLTYRDS